MQAFKSEPVHSKGVQEQQENVTNQNFQHQNTDPRTRTPKGLGEGVLGGDSGFQ